MSHYSGVPTSNFQVRRAELVRRRLAAAVSARCTMDVAPGLGGDRACIACLAVIGKPPSNDPLYMRVFDQSESQLDFHYFVHAALDIVEERIDTPRAPSLEPSSAHDAYLGFLCPVDHFRIYGYVTNSHTKFMVVVQDVVVRDADIKSLFRWLHGLYVDTILNPFISIDGAIESPSFDSEVDKVVTSFESILQQRMQGPSP